MQGGVSKDEDLTLVNDIENIQSFKIIVERAICGGL